MTQPIEDWEREAEKEDIFAQERAGLMEQEYFEYLRLPAKITAKITHKKQKHGTKNNTTPFPRTSKESI